MTEIKATDFNILQYHNWYRALKQCSKTGILYDVYLESADYRRYYTKVGKKVNHLRNKLSENDVLFLETTLTPAEIASLSDEIKSTTKKQHWRKYFGKKLDVDESTDSDCRELETE